MANKRITDVDIVTSLDSDESFFINKNNTIKQINKNNIVVGIANGGTGATSIDEIKKLLGISIEDLGITTERIGAQSQHITITVSLPKSGWSNKKQTVTANGVTSTNTIIVGANPSCQKTYSESGVFCSAQQSNELTFSCELVPSSDIQANIIIMN